MLGDFSSVTLTSHDKFQDKVQDPALHPSQGTGVGVRAGSFTESGTGTETGTGMRVGIWARGWVRDRDKVRVRDWGGEYVILHR